MILFILFPYYEQGGLGDLDKAGENQTPFISLTDIISLNIVNGLPPTKPESPKGNILMADWPGISKPCR